MRVAVTGSTGFLGSAISRHLVALGDDVLAIDHHGSECPLDLADHTSLPRLALALEGCAEVYHLAGVLGTSELDTLPFYAIDNNITATVTVLEAARRAGLERFFLPAKPNVWNNVYTISRRAAQDFGLLHAHNGWLDVRLLCYFNLFGPGQRLLPVRKMVPTFIAHALTGHPLPVYGSGEQTVDLVHVDDAARLTVQFLRGPRPEPGSIPEVGRGLALTVTEVADTINRLCHTRAGIRHLPMRQGETKETNLSANGKSFAMYEFGSLVDQLDSTIQWYRDNFSREALEEVVALMVSHDRS